MRAVGRMVTFLLMDDDLKRELEIELGQFELDFHRRLSSTLSMKYFSDFSIS
jgi:hypothetical protein